MDSKKFVGFLVTGLLLMIAAVVLIVVYLFEKRTTITIPVEIPTPVMDLPAVSTEVATPNADATVGDGSGLEGVKLWKGLMDPIAILSVKYPAMWESFLADEIKLKSEYSLLEPSRMGGLVPYKDFATMGAYDVQQYLLSYYIQFHRTDLWTEYQEIRSTASLT